MSMSPETIELLQKYQTGQIPDMLLKQPVVEQLTSQSASTLEQARLKGTGIPFVKIGRSVRYRLSDVSRFISELPVFRSTTEADYHNHQAKGRV
ncbi:MAG: hypothetical protein VB050_04930 [Geobacteraceae bacterium]|nr:hypothetical protein [Geobacteraceae bacterium]